MTLEPRVVSLESEEVGRWKEGRTRQPKSHGGSSRLLKKSISATVGALYERPLFVESRKDARS
jgi:hypothetical protein